MAELTEEQDDIVSDILAVAPPPKPPPEKPKRRTIRKSSTARTMSLDVIDYVLNYYAQHPDEVSESAKRTPPALIDRKEHYPGVIFDSGRYPKAIRTEKKK